MCVKRKLCQVTLGLVLVSAGCLRTDTKPELKNRDTKPELKNRDSVLKCVPRGVRLSMEVWNPDRATRAQPVTVEQRLVELGAHVESDGKLYDASGKEIYFFLEFGYQGTARDRASPIEEKSYQDELRNASEHHTVIRVDNHCPYPNT